MNISNVEMMMRNNIQPLKKIIGIFLFFLSIILFIVFIGLIIQGPDVFNSLNSSIIDQKINYVYFFFMALPFAFRLFFHRFCIEVSIGPGKIIFERML